MGRMRIEAITDGNMTDGNMRVKHLQDACRIPRSDDVDYTDGY